MSSGATAVESVNDWLNQYREIFGVSQLELLTRSTFETRNKEFVMIMFDQKVSGRPVDLGHLTFVVRRGSFSGRENPVVHVGARLAHVTSPSPKWPQISDSNIFRKIRISKLLEKASDDVIMKDNTDNLVTEGFKVIEDGALVVWRDDERSAQWAYRFRIADSLDLPKYSWTVYIHPTTQGIIEVRNNIHSAQLSGEVTGEMSPGTLPHIPSNPARSHSMPWARMHTPDGVEAFTNLNGQFAVETYQSFGEVAVNLTSPYVSIASSQARIVSGNFVYPPTSDLRYPLLRRIFSITSIICVITFIIGLPILLRLIIRSRRMRINRWVAMRLSMG